MADGKISQELLDQLTDEERAGVEDDTQDETSSRVTDDAEAEANAADEKAKADAAAKTKAGAEETSKNTDEEEADAAALAEAEKRQNEEAAKKAADDKAAADKKAEETKKGEGEAAEGEDEEGDDEPPIPNWQPPADLKPKYDDVAKRKSELALKFDEGDIGARDYQAELDKLNSEEKALDREVIKAETKAEMGRDMRIANWTEVTVPDFNAEHPEYEDPDLNNMLDAKVRQLQTADDSPYKNTPLSPRVLEAAHKALTEAAAKLGGVKTSGEAAGEKKDANGKAKLEVRKPAERKLAPNLGAIPASDINDTGEGRFAALDKLKGVEYEDAFAKLSEADQEAYLRQ